MTVNIELDSTLRRYGDGFNAKTSTLDVTIIILLILSSITYISSVMKTSKLAKVWAAYCIYIHTYVYSIYPIKSGII